MKHLNYYIEPIMLNLTIAIISMVCGCIAYHNNKILTDFEVILIVVSVFMLIKGIFNFIDKIWLV